MARWLWLSLAVVLVDQVSKHLAEAMLMPHDPKAALSWLNFTLAYNTGAAFSFLAGSGGWQRWLFLALASVISVVLLFWLIRLERGQRWQAIALAMILGGAIGNLIDRALFGHVIDFLDLHHIALGGWPGFSEDGHWPVFNVADMAITGGAIVLIIDAFTGKQTDTASQAG